MFGRPKRAASAPGPRTRADLYLVTWTFQQVFPSVSGSKQPIGRLEGPQDLGAKFFESPFRFDRPESLSPAPANLDHLQVFAAKASITVELPVPIELC